MEIAVIVGMVAQAAGLVALLVGFVYGYGKLSQTVSDLKQNMSHVFPRLTDLTRLEEIVKSVVLAVDGLQATIRNSFAQRLDRLETEVAEIKVRCTERHHKDG